MKFTEKLRTELSQNKKLLFLVLLGIIGILLLGLSEILPSKNAEKENAPKDADASVALSSVEYCTSLEKKLETVLSAMDGVGRVKVLLTLESSDEKIYAVDEKSNTKNTESATEHTFDSKYVRTDRKAGEDGMILKTNAPKIKGAMIVCDGGENPAVAKNITDAVSATLGIGLNAVSVLKMKT